MTREISVVVPIYNEEQNLRPLCMRLLATLNTLGKTYELIFVNDGSKDHSREVLQQLYEQHPQELVVVDFSSNFGQHMAVMAGFEQSRGEVVVTLDADLQNPPEEIPKLLALIAQGHDLVSGVRLHDRKNKDSWFRRNISILVNKVRALITNIKMTDHGCMLRAYNRNLVNLMAAHQEASVFIPALAYFYAVNPAEVRVQHEERCNGESKYSLYSLIKLNFDLMTGYSIIPLQIFSMLGISIVGLSLLSVIILFLGWIVHAITFSVVPLLIASLFLLLGVLFIGLGITGEYIGRIYREVRHYPRFTIKKITRSQEKHEE